MFQFAYHKTYPNISKERIIKIHSQNLLYIEQRSYKHDDFTPAKPEDTSGLSLDVSTRLDS